MSFSGLDQLNSMQSRRESKPNTVQGTVKKLIQQFGVKSSAPKIDINVLNEIDENLKQIQSCTNKNNNLDTFQIQLNSYYEKRKENKQSNFKNEMKMSEIDYKTYSPKNKNNQVIEKLIQVYEKILLYLQTGKFNAEQSIQKKSSQVSATVNVQPSLFLAGDDLPDIEEINQIIGLLIDLPDHELQSLKPKYIDELKKLAAIILFRVRNKNYDLDVQ